MSVNEAPITVMIMRIVKTQLAPFCVCVKMDTEATDKIVKVRNRISWNSGYKMSCPYYITILQAYILFYS